MEIEDPKTLIILNELWNATNEICEFSKIKPGFIYSKIVIKGVINIKANIALKQL